MPTKPMNPKERILRAVVKDSNDCWNWQLSIDHGGYGRMKISTGSRQDFYFESAHRRAFEVLVGDIPNGLHVLHKCDNRKCCNPDHLFLGTHQDNMHDMQEKGRAGGGRSKKTIKAIDAARATQKGQP